ncbi:hypothetical protein BpHYR1_045022 [Brachionus plicatilis]|uniref:Uncharacterized protein n=1 Tax=Brachionus plicatilis TaxID=10195 RepID=A0A3M7P779_BRAPC|nr:hypothetical protein BpHYR1_045022 [Brachionus plicatilis]
MLKQQFSNEYILRAISLLKIRHKFRTTLPAIINSCGTGITSELLSTSLLANEIFWSKSPKFLALWLAEPHSTKTTFGSRNQLVCQDQKTALPEQNSPLDLLHYMCTVDSKPRYLVVAIDLFSQSNIIK